MGMSTYHETAHSNEQAMRKRVVVTCALVASLMFVCGMVASGAGEGESLFVFTRNVNSERLFHRELLLGLKSRPTPAPTPAPSPTKTKSKSKGTDSFFMEESASEAFLFNRELSLGLKSRRTPAPTPAPTKTKSKSKGTDSFFMEESASEAFLFSRRLGGESLFSRELSLGLKSRRTPAPTPAPTKTKSKSKGTDSFFMEESASEAFLFSRRLGGESLFSRELSLGLKSRPTPAPTPAPSPTKTKSKSKGTDSFFIEQAYEEEQGDIMNEQE